MAAPGLAALDSLADVLECVSSRPRLEILSAVRSPKTLSEIRIHAQRNRAGEHEARPLARQTVAHHLERLLEVGLVERVQIGGRDCYVLAHERMYAVVEEFRGLAKLRATMSETSGRPTIEAGEVGDAGLPARPRLLLARGRDDGVGFALGGPVGARFTIGRAPDAEVRLDYDPFVSQRNTIVERRADGFVVEDTGSKNGTLLDWAPLAPGRGVALQDGALIVVGRSVLVFQGP
jgi:ArsR family transcriptional regulator